MVIPSKWDFHPVENDELLKAFISMKRCNQIFVLERSLCCHCEKKNGVSSQTGRRPDEEGEGLNEGNGN